MNDNLIIKKKEKNLAISALENSRTWTKDFHRSLNCFNVGES